MRITITGMIVLMILTLLAGIVAVRVLLPEKKTAGGSVVVVLVDAGGVNDLGGRLLEDPPPALAGLIERGISFLDCKSPSPWYPAAAASLLTGLYPEEHGLTRNHPRLTLRANTLAEECAAAGYHTYLFAGEDSLLVRTGVLQGFQHRFATGEGEAAAGAAFEFVAATAGRFPFFALVEINARRCGGLAGLYRVLDRFASSLEGTDFLDGNILVLCAPGGSLPEGADALRQGRMRASLFLAGASLKTSPGKVYLKTTSLVDVVPAVKKALGSYSFDMRDSARTGHAVMAEVESARENPQGGVAGKFPSRFRRMIWFDDLPFLCLIDEGGALRFQDDGGAPIVISKEREELARRRIAVFLAGLEPLADPSAGVPVRSSGGSR